MRRCGLLLALIVLAAVAAAGASSDNAVNAGSYYLLTTDRTDAQYYAHDARIVRVPANGDAMTTFLSLRVRAGTGPTVFDLGNGPRPTHVASTYNWSLTGVSRDGKVLALSRQIIGFDHEAVSDVLYSRAGGFVTIAECTDTTRTNPVTHAVLGETYRASVLGCPDDVSSVSPSGDRAALFVTKPKRGTWFAIVDAAGHAHTVEKSACSVPSRPAWSPDERHLAYICGDTNKASTTIHIVGVDGRGDATVPGTAALHPDSDLSWSGDGKSLLFIGEPFHRTDRFDSEAVERGYMQPDQMLLTTEVLPMSVGVDGSNGDLFGPTCCMAYAPAGFESEGLLGEDQKGAWHAFATPRDTGTGLLVWAPTVRIGGRAERANDAPFWAQN